MNTNNWKEFKVGELGFEIIHGSSMIISHIWLNILLLQQFKQKITLNILLMINSGKKMQKM